MTSAVMMKKKKQKRRTAHFLTTTYQILSFIIYADVYCHLYVCDLCYSILIETMPKVIISLPFRFFCRVLLIKLPIYLLLFVLYFFALSRDRKPNYSILHRHAHTFKRLHTIISTNNLRNYK